MNELNLAAFRGDDAVKQQALDRLRGLQQSGEWVARPLHWNGKAGSLVGSLLQSEDLGGWEAHLGLPKWLALALDAIFVSAPSVDEGVDRGVTVLDALAPGTRLDVAGSRMLLGLLDDEDMRAAVSGSGALTDALCKVSTLHRRLLNGETVPAATWRTARRETVALTDGLPPGSLPAASGACIEAAAWDPASSRTAVSDTLRTWFALKALAATAPHWTAEDDARIQSLGNRLQAEARAQATDPAAFIDVFKLIEDRHPGEATRLKAHLRRQREAQQHAWQQAARLLQQSLSHAGQDTEPPLIPRAHLFANPARAGIGISPDGAWLAWLANDGGVMNIWAAPRERPHEARQLTFDAHRGVHGFNWTRTPGLLLYSQDRDGDENWRLYGVNAASGEVRELTPLPPGARASVLKTSRKRPGEVAVTMNARDPRHADVYLLDLASGNLTLLEENPGFGGYLLDDDYRVRIAARSTSDGGAEYLRRTADGGWAPWICLSAEDARSSGPTHFSADGDTLYFRDSRGRDTAALVAIDMASGESTVLAEDPRADIGGTINDVDTYRPLAYAATYERYRLHVLDRAIGPDIEFLDARLGEWGLGSRTADDRLWVLNSSSDTRPAATWLYDRDARTLTHLLDVRPELAEAPLSRMQPVVIDARDGLGLVSYLTIPVQADAGDLRSVRPLPLVLLVHGGPWARDGFGYNGMHQWLANRGYAVLSVNFRGSTGFGKAFINAADGEWGRKMDEDLEDAVAWAIGRGIADPKRLGIFGGSYGGYAVLSALTRYPDRYACAIDLFGPSNLQSLLAATPPYWESARAMQRRAIGDFETEEGRALLRERSPLFRAAAIRTPLLIAQGGNDPRVPQAESEQMVAALKENGIPVTYALYPDEGHGFVREPNRMSFNALCESFLARHLGGRVEPWEEGDFPGSTLRIVEDARREAA